MRHRHPLRPPGRPRRIHHVRQLARRHRSLRPRAANCRTASAPDHPAASSGPAPARRPAPPPSPRTPRPLSASMHADPLGRITRIHRQVRRPRLSAPPAAAATSSADRSRHHRDHPPRPRPRPGQVPRQTVRPRIQLPVTDSAHPRTPPRPHPASPPPAPRSAPAPSPPVPGRRCRSTRPAAGRVRPPPAPQPGAAGWRGPAPAR